jgi:hypothetical protein
MLVQRPHIVDIGQKLDTCQQQQAAGTHLLQLAT